jgi:RNA polymerase sigma-70 factor (ECF subfamily)
MERPTMIRSVRMLGVLKPDALLPAHPQSPLLRAVNVSFLLFVLVVMLVLPETAGRGPAGDADAAIRQLYACHAKALRRYVERFCSDRASADDIVQETFIRAWRHLAQLSSADFPVRPWLFRVARNLLIDAERATRSRPVGVQLQPAEEGRDDTRLNGVLDHQIVAEALRQLSPEHRAVLVETFYQGRALAKVARQLGIPYGTARSRLHYALRALRRQLEDREAIEPQ